jgi:hypothetical protein
MKPANILVPAILFIIFTPDLLFSLPNKDAPKWEKVLVHVLIFGVTYGLLRIVFKSYY